MMLVAVGYNIEERGDCSLLRRLFSKLYGGITQVQLRDNMMLFRGQHKYRDAI